MNQPSDLRLGGSLLATATLICGLFAVAALIPFIKWNADVTPAEIPEPASPTTLGQNDQQGTGEHPAGTVSAQFSRDAAVSAAEIAFQRSPMTRVVTRSGTGANVTKDPALPQSVLESQPRGVYVPVNVHPVTVNIDGSGFIEQLSHLATGMDEMVTAQREVSKWYRVATGSESFDRTSPMATAGRDERLTQIDASLRELSSAVESLRTESRTSVTKLTEDFKKAEVSSDLLQEFRKSLAQHRQLLAESTRLHPTPAARIAQHPDPGSDLPSDGHDDFLNSESADQEAELPTWDSPTDAAEPSTPDVPLPPEADRRASASPWPDAILPPADAEPALLAAESTLGMDQPVAVMALVTRAPELAKLTIPALPPHDVSAAAASRSGVAQLHLPLLPAEDNELIRTVPATPSGEPVVFEQMFSFVLPPVIAPPVTVERKTAEIPGRIEQLQPVIVNEPTAKLNPTPAVQDRRTAVPAPVSRKSVPPKSTQMPRRTSRFLPRFSYPKSGTALSQTRQATPLRNGINRTVDTDLDVNKSAWELAQRRHRGINSSAATTTARRPVFHRLGAAVRGVGRSRIVN